MRAGVWAPGVSSLGLAHAGACIHTPGGVLVNLLAVSVCLFLVICGSRKSIIITDTSKYLQSNNAVKLEAFISRFLQVCFKNEATSGGGGEKSLSVSGLPDPLVVPFIV